MKNSLLVVILFCSVSCNEKRKDEHHAESKQFFFKITDDEGINSYNSKEYEFLGDTIKVSSTTIDDSGKKINLGVKRYLRTKDELYMLIPNGKSFRKELFFSNKYVDSCYIVKHPLVDLKLCYKGVSDFLNFEDAYKISYSQQAIDGIDMDMFLDKDFTLIAKTNVIGTAVFREEIRIMKHEVPIEIIDKLLK